RAVLVEARDREVRAGGRLVGVAGPNDLAVLLYPYSDRLAARPAWEGDLAVHAEGIRTGVVERAVRGEPGEGPVARAARPAGQHDLAAALDRDRLGVVVAVRRLVEADRREAAAAEVVPVV